MLPRSLQIDLFAAYPPEARKLVAAHLATLQQLPLSFLPSLLRETIDYDYKFPAERIAIEQEYSHLASLTQDQRNAWFQAFTQLSVPARLESFDWINQPSQFLEQQSAHLWSTHQLDAFRQAATEYGDRLQSARPPEKISVSRLGVAVIGQGVATYEAPLFRSLRKHGTYFGNVKPDNGLALILAAAHERARSHPLAYGHWYVDGGLPVDHGSSLTCISYQAMDPMRAALLKTMQRDISRPGMGPEELRTHMAKLLPSDLTIPLTGDPVLDRFQLRIFTEGSGTQIFSTTFAQWTAREAMRRAQPLTLVVRFAPRQQQRPMNVMLSDERLETQLDPAGSLVDADMAAYYHWLNQQRLAGAEQSAFLVWFEGHDQALAIGPSLPRNTSSSSATDIGQLLKLITT